MALQDSANCVLAGDQIHKIESTLWSGCLIFLNIRPEAAALLWRTIQLNTKPSEENVPLGIEEAKKTKVKNYPFEVLLLKYIIGNLRTTTMTLSTTTGSD